MHAYLINLTPHTIHLHQTSGAFENPVTFKSDGVARASEIVEVEPDLHWCVFGDCGMHDHIPLVRKRYGSVEGLPEPRQSVAYIVSQVVADACPDRDDLLVPHDMVRDDAGRVVGCRGFSRPTRLKAPGADALRAELAIAQGVSERIRAELRRLAEIDGLHLGAEIESWIAQ